MAIVFCNDDGSNTAPHETWAKAATTFLVAVDFASAGDDIHIGADHAETPGTVTYAFPGTKTAFNRVISVTVDTTTYNKADNVQIDAAVTTDDVTITGHVQFYGVSIKIGDDLNVNQAASEMQVYDDCLLELTRVSSFFALGSTSGGAHTIFRNTEVNFSGGGTGSGISPRGMKFDWYGGKLSWTSTQASGGVFRTIDRNTTMSVSGVDLTDITDTLVNLSGADLYTASFHHCLLASGVSLTGTVGQPGASALMSGCDDTTGNDLYRLEYVDFWGSTVHDDATFRSGGASDGTTPISWKMVSTSDAVEVTEPTVSPPIVEWIDSTGSKTLTINCLWDSATDIQDDEIWVEFEFLSASADVESDLASDRLLTNRSVEADILAAPADQTTNSDAWTISPSMTNANKFQLNATVTINRVGPVIARVYLAKPSTTVFVDWLIVVT